MQPFRGGTARPLIVGHRGVRGAGVIENTPDAFSAAAAAGADAVELDVRRTRDDALAVHHDACLRAGEAVCDLTVPDLAAAGVFTLTQVLSALPPGLGVDIELKNLPHEPDYDETERIVQLVAEVVHDHAADRAVLLSSFNPFTVASMTEVIPDATVGLVTASTVPLSLGIELALEQAADFVCPNAASQGLDAAAVAVAHDAGLGVLVWTVNDLEQGRQLAEAGVDALCSDQPGPLRNALVEGGLLA